MQIERCYRRSHLPAFLLATLAFTGATARNSLEWLSDPSNLWGLTQSIFKILEKPGDHLRRLC
jgi:hypothetical protein